MREDLVTLIEQCEAQISNVEMEVVKEQTWFKKKRGRPEADVEPAEPVTITVRTVLEGPPGGKGRVEYDGVLPWINQDGHIEAPSRTIVCHAFNGKVGTEIVFCDLPGREGMPTTQALCGQRRSDMVAMLSTSGMDLISKYFNDVGLAESLKRSSDWIVERSDDEFIVRLPDVKDTPQGYWQIRLAINRGMAITGWDFCYDGHPFFGYRNMTLQEVKGIWLPASCEYYTLTSIDKITFRSVKVNEELDPGVFVLDFLPGYPIEDYVADMVFTAGPGSDDALLSDVTEALARAADLGVSGPNEAAAISSNAPQPGARETVGVVVRRPPYGVYLILLILALLIVVLLLFAYRAKLLRRGPPLMLLLGVISCCFLPACSANADADKDLFYSREVGGKEVPVYQCGLYAVVVTLRNNEIDCDLDAIREYLRCTRQGTTMLALKNTLTAYGLLVRPVESLDADYLRRHLVDGGSAIVWTAGRGGGDFVPLIGCAREGVVCIHYPRGAVTLDDRMLSSLLRKGGGKALLIDAGRAPALGPNLTLDPAETDLGEMDPGREEITVRLSLKNTSSSTLLIKGTRVPCGGCMQAGLVKRWLEPGETSEITCTVKPGLWRGAARRFVDVLLSDGSHVLAYVKGTARSTRLDAIYVTPSEMLFTDESFGGADEVAREVRLEWDKDMSLVLSEVSSADSWLSVSVLADAERVSGRNRSRILITAARREVPGLTEGRVACRFKGVKDPVLVRVKQYHVIPFRAVPPLVVLAGDAPSADVKIVSAERDAVFMLEEVTAKIAGIDASWRKGEATGELPVTLSLHSGVDVSAREVSLAKVLFKLTAHGQSYTVPVFVDFRHELGAIL